MEWEAHYLALKNMLDADRHTEGMDERQLRSWVGLRRNTDHIPKLE